MSTVTATCTRGTTNGNARGSSEARRRRKQWLILTYRADVAVLQFTNGLLETDKPQDIRNATITGPGIQVACRCYRCGKLLTFDTVTIDRIVPGCQGGTYRRNNIRPACGPCNSETGGPVRSK